MPRFDCILYIDVLEHIENDRQELIEAKKRLKPGGRLIILAPAHQKLMSPFDKAIGHFRRYSRRSLQDIIPGGMAQVRTLYADSLGLLASIVNRWILRQTMPRKEQIRFWDDRLIPGSRVTDKILLHLAGRSIIGIWEKTSK
jgi:2-polyprenyl-3-methyl-5-hydroxy-6-metoxy-1,4-benzoquinol methylase